MFFPIGDTPNPYGYQAWVTWLIIGINIAIYALVSLPLSMQPPNLNDPQVQAFINMVYPGVASRIPLESFVSQLSAYDVFTFMHGYKPGAPALDDLFFSIFLHGGLMHLAGNMLFLWIYGDNVEHRLGRMGFLAAYLLSGVAATLSFALFAGNSMTPLVGASGAISGVLGMYFLLFPRNSVKVFVFLFPFFMDVVLLPARLVLGFFILIDNLLPVLAGSQSSVAYGAHIGGFFAGLAFAQLGEHYCWQMPWQHRQSCFEAQGNTQENFQQDQAPLEMVRKAILAGDSRQAIRGYAQLEKRDLPGLNPHECVILADWLEEAGHHVASSNLLRSYLARNARFSDLAQVNLALGLLRLKQGQPTSAYQYLRGVFDHQPDPQTARLAREALEQINIYRGSGRG